MDVEHRGRRAETLEKGKEGPVPEFGCAESNSWLLSVSNTEDGAVPSTQQGHWQHSAVSVSPAYSPVLSLEYFKTNTRHLTCKYGSAHLQGHPMKHNTNSTPNPTNSLTSSNARRSFTFLPVSETISCLELRKLNKIRSLHLAVKFPRLSSLRTVLPPFSPPRPALMSLPCRQRWVSRPEDVPILGFCPLPCDIISAAPRCFL